MYLVREIKEYWHGQEKYLVLLLLLVIIIFIYLTNK